MKNQETAETISLQYISDSISGITRKLYGTKFVYYNSDGSRVIDRNILTRINSLAVPPAYKDVWISPISNGHIQATGRDSRNRKQYRYHPLWRQIRQENKFMEMIPFGKKLPLIREHIELELTKSLTMNKSQIICAIIYLLDNHFIRIGNAIYEKQNKSFGLTTLRKRHLSLSSSKAVLDFEGKNSKPWHVVLKDKKIINILKKCEAIPGYRLFKYLDENNNYSEITSQDINEYLQNLTGLSFTAKDFRTWGACRETLYRLSQINYKDEVTSQEALKKIISEVALILGHTPAVCQKCYIYPDIITKWKETKIINWVKRHTRLSHDKDKLLLHWLEDHINQL
jgi:DNA topoisomerase-1